MPTDGKCFRFRGQSNLSVHGIVVLRLGVTAEFCDRWDRELWLDHAADTFSVFVDDLYPFMQIQKVHAVLVEGIHESKHNFWGTLRVDLSNAFVGGPRGNEKICFFAT